MYKPNTSFIYNCDHIFSMQPHPSYDMMGVAALKIQVTLSHDCASLSLGTRQVMTNQLIRGWLSKNTMFKLYYLL